MLNLLWVWLSQLFPGYYFDEFQQFVTLYSKIYSSPQERHFRQTVFLHNFNKISLLNQQHAGKAFFAVNQFADLTTQQIRQRYQGLADIHNLQAPIYTTQNDIVPQDWDWRSHGAVTRVRNQGACGSCWAFSVAQNIQGQFFKHTGNLTMMSAQQLVDCDKNNFGCNGGWPWNAIRWLTAHGGLETEQDYPQNDNYHVTCTFDLPKAVVHPTGYLNITKDQQQLKKAVYEIGPISIGLDFSELQFYRRGIASPRLCSNYPDHALLLVGYGVQKDEPYWIVKNSWGEKWGEHGYFRLQRGHDRCGIKDWACTAVL